MGRFNNNKTLSTRACNPKIRIIVAAMGFGVINVYRQYLVSNLYTQFKK